MNSEQLSLFQEPSEAITKAIETLSTSTFKGRPSYINFIRELGSLMTTQPAGSIILAATPNSYITKIACESLKIFLEEFNSRNQRPEKAELAVLDIPHAQNTKAQHKQLADIYTSSLPVSKLNHTHKPQFELDFAMAYAQATPMQQICCTIRNRPITHYLLRNAHYISPSGSSVSESTNQLRYFAQLAAQSNKTHVLFANGFKINEWLNNSEISGEFPVCWIKPYNKNDQQSYREFKGVIKSFDVILPREAEFRLLDQADAIFEIVAGCPYRLNKWLISALSLVNANGAQHLDWRYLYQSKPTPAEQKNAKSESSQILTNTPFLAPGIDTVKNDEVKPKKRKTRPQRNLGRDEVGQDAIHPPASAA
ncbi:MAG: hypothetical protein WC661_02060 [Opitutaceae bacterium]|jgi:hypothetical protein